MHVDLTQFEGFVYHLNDGYRAGGGIADLLLPAVDSSEIHEVGRFLYSSSFLFECFSFDLSYYILITVILTAIVSGIVIDAFGKHLHVTAYLLGDIRDQHTSTEEDIRTKCFICGLNNGIFGIVEISSLRRVRKTCRGIF